MLSCIARIPELQPCLAFPGFRVQGLGFRVQGLGLGVSDLGFRVWVEGAEGELGLCDGCTQGQRSVLRDVHGTYEAAPLTVTRLEDSTFSYHAGIDAPCSLTLECWNIEGSGPYPQNAHPPYHATKAQPSNEKRKPSGVHVAGLGFRV